MCGIAGIISTQSSIINLEALKRMGHSLAHRGPDGEGYWISKTNNAGFAHRRLSIIDLTPLSAQPMHLRERYTIVHNGEIYNYIEIRNELKKAGYQFQSSGDCEVILAAYDCYKEKCIHFFDGMFSFAIWDEEEKTFFAARDRFGEKPFYYLLDKNNLYFGSEMKALWATGIEKEFDERMMLNYLALGYIQNTNDKFQTFYKNISSLPPAHYMYFHPLKETFSIHHYWDIDKQAFQKISEEEATQTLDNLIAGSINKRLRSDVPIGTNLSGGIDSSTIAWFVRNRVKAKGPANFKTFSAVFPGFEKNEASFINEVCSNLQLQNNTVVPEAVGLVDKFEKLLYHQEEPFTSASVYAQFKVFELAKQHGVKVLLDGQGADEILAGYHKYFHWFLQEMVSRNRFVLANREKQLLKKNNIAIRWDIKNFLAAFLPSHAAIALEKIEYRKILHQPDLTRDFLGHMKGREWEGIHKPIITKLNDILYYNTTKYGLEELLRYADRNSMAHGTEVRLPFLSPALVEFVFSLPSVLKIHDGYTKWILRKLVDNKLPATIVWRRDKIGFEPPQKMWMEHPHLKEYLQSAKQALVKEKILKPAVLNKKQVSLDANAADNYDWRYLCMGTLLNK